MQVTDFDVVGEANAASLSCEFTLSPLELRAHAGNIIVLRSRNRAKNIKSRG